MRVNFILALSIASAVTALPQDSVPMQMSEQFCNSGVDGDGGCEANGLITACCIQLSPSGEFKNKRLPTVSTKNSKGEILCGKAPDGSQGVRYCVPK
ncbi:hypothetical protein HYFRA_00012422 [Hymenoscyphus fraxineus]|uniref:Hydrophobin n=1 Tax=Hymenoscyphus fraxineus TaxID=746836 RepID=A0A9N9L966_9HELO|nr:hypothetical protein HYFRA_00012422 [Hymenoscyphus fraxineus]